MSEIFKVISDASGVSLFSLGKTNFTLGSLIAIVAFVIGIWVLAAWVEKSITRFSRRLANDHITGARLHMLSRLVRYAVWIIGTVVGLNYLGLDLTSITLLGSALAVGLGFGLQNVFSNFVSGIIILLEQSLKVGDFVDLQSGVRGHVKEIAMRYTRVTTNDSLDVLVPNSEFINGRVVNWTLDDSHRRMRVPFGVAYGTPKELVREAGLAAVSKIPGIINTETMRCQVWLVSYGDSSMNYELIVWASQELTTHPASTQAKIMWALDDELAARNIEIPFPQRVVHMKSGQPGSEVVALDEQK